VGEGIAAGTMPEDDGVTAVELVSCGWLAGVLDPEQAFAIAPIKTSSAMTSATKQPHPDDCCFDAIRFPLFLNLPRYMTHIYSLWMTPLAGTCLVRREPALSPCHIEARPGHSRILALSRNGR
jgi:hypothetical protein